MLPKPALLAAVALVGGWCVPARAQQAPPGSGDSGLSPAPSPIPAAPDGPLFGSAPPPPPEPSAADARPFRPPPGWFAGAGLFLTRPYSRPFLDFFFGGPGEAVSDLGTTLSPLATLGYRFARDNALLVSYRYFGSAADNDRTYPGSYFLHAHTGLSSNWVDLDYRGCLHGPWLWFTFQWQTGCRLVAVDYAARSATPYSSGKEHTTFFGAGPHFGIDLDWYLGPTGRTRPGRSDLGVVFGRTTKQAATHEYSDGSYVVFGPTDFQTNSAKTQGSLNGLAECGLSWAPATRRWLRFEGGYQVFWFTMTENHLFTNSGPFLRCEVGF
jgi:hypothetical protein